MNWSRCITGGKNAGVFDMTDRLMMGLRLLRQPIHSKRTSEMEENRWNRHHAEINSAVCGICLYDILCNETCVANTKACILIKYRLKSIHRFSVVYNFLPCYSFITKWIQSEMIFDLIPSGIEPGTNQSPFQIECYLFDGLLTEFCFRSTYSRISPAGFFHTRSSVANENPVLFALNSYGNILAKMCR